MLQLTFYLQKLLSFNFPKRAKRANFFNFFNFPIPATFTTKISHYGNPQV